jgi:hypothetical protein
MFLIAGVERLVSGFAGEDHLPLKKKDRKCLDCSYCQGCSKNRCRLCRSGKKVRTRPALASCFTYEEYQRWKVDRDHKGKAD